MDLSTTTARWTKFHEGKQNNLIPWGRTKTHELLNQKLIRAKKCGKTLLIDLESVDAYIANLPDYGAAS